MISIAYIYDVLTARDTYCRPSSSSDAIAELRDVAGSQLDGRFVELFIEILEREGIGFTHTEDADFEKELALEGAHSRIGQATSRRRRRMIRGWGAGHLADRRVPGLAPSLPEHIAAGDLVIEGVEAAILVLLGTAVQHALESTNPVHALGAADGSSRFGTHQVLLLLPVHR